MIDRFLSPKYLTWFAAALFVVGAIARLLPLLDINGRLLQQFATEDGYLMLTIARNIALGNGMSTADGTQLTNGTQPFTTLLWTLGYLITQGDKILGVIAAHWIQIFASVATSFFYYLLAKKVFSSHEFSHHIALILAGLAFSSPHLLPESMNFLETGIYFLAVSIVIYVFYETDNEAKEVWSIGKSVTVGLLLGWMFWVRIDSIFVIFAACITYIYRGLPNGITQIKKRFFRTLLFGSVSVMVAAPWLAYNYLYFGSIMPISGQAQSLSTGEFAPNAIVVPSILIEYLLVFLPIPHRIQEAAYIVWPCTILAIVAVLVLIYVFVQAEHRHRALIVMGSILTISVVTYYGLFFGAKHFVARYLSVITPFFMLFSASCILALYPQIKRFVRFLVPVVPIVTIFIIIALNYRIYLLGDKHQHFQVINWVENNVSKSTWVGAIQTGTLGYFHDRTINLDGKVNPDALAARLGKASCPDLELQSSDTPPDCLMYYVVDSEIQYLVDWAGIGTWINNTPVNKHFELIVNDPELNLAVLERIGAPSKSL